MENFYLKIQNLSKVYNPNTSGSVLALDNFSLDVQKGDFVTIIGNNAAGKTTLFNLISGTLKPGSGNVYLNGQDITMLSEYEKSSFISRVRQNPNDNIAISMTLAENLAMAKMRSHRPGLRKGVKTEWKDEFIKLLQPFELGLEKRLDDKIDLLSGGQKQTVALLMATMNNPKLLLLDEHTAALDPKISRTILKITDDIVNEKGITTLMITHNLNNALDHGNKIVLMQSGKLRFIANKEEKEKLTVVDLVEKIESSGVEI